MATIRFKRGTTAGSIPSGLTHGEPAVNTTDEILYCGNSAGNTINITGVQTVNGATGNVTLADLVGVSTFNGASGAVEGVGSFNGATGAVEGVGSFNGLTGAVTTTSSTLHVGGLSADNGATLGGNLLFGGDYHIRNSANNTLIDFEGDRNLMFGDVDSAGNDTTIHMRDSHSSLNLSAAGQIELGAPIVYVPDKIIHKSDSNTFINFTADDVVIQAGGNEFLHGTSTYTELGGATFGDGGATFGGNVTATTFVGDVTGDVTGTSDVATVATTVTITDNESENEDNAIIFTAGGDVDGGNLGLESDGTLTYNPSTGKVTTTLLGASVQATALSVGGNYNLPTSAGATGDILMIAADGDLEFESFKTTATFIVDSDIPLATGIRYKGLYQVPLDKMDVTNIELRSHDVSPAGFGDSLSVALKAIQRSSGLEAASPTIQFTVETAAIPLGGEYHIAVSESGVDTPGVGSDNAGMFLVVDVVSNAGNHTNFTMLVEMEARP